MNKERTQNASLSHYRIISKIGAGGMGEVFLAHDTKLDRKVALKILPKEFAEDADRMNRFVREAKSASALNHPNIITIYEIGESDGTHFIATEFIDGKTLSDFAKANPLNIKSALEIAIQVASALDEAHAAGIVHRDIKPDNVMIRANGLVKILDFGIAKLVEMRNADLGLRNREAETLLQPPEKNPQSAIPNPQSTTPGMIIGTPQFMSPEQARGKDVDHQTDIFSFGVVFYEMLSGDSPFSGETVSDVIAAVLTKEPKILSEIPPELEQLLNKTLEKDKKNRYQTAKDLLTDLQEAKEELSVQSRLEKTSSPNLSEPKTQILQAVTTAENDSNKSIAVLPFTNMYADEDNEYFCEGLAEELLNALSKIEDLKVAARTSAFSFKGKNANVSEIGEKLSVKNVLEGSVRKSGNKLRISVQLVNASDGYQLWSERYDREMKDIFDVQDEIALAVVEVLKVKLFGDEKAAVLKRGTENKESFQLYLKGRYHFAKRTKEDHFKAIDYFQQAVALDSNFALAYVGIADSYNSMVKGSDISQKEAISQSKAAAAKALEIDPTLAEAHATLADSLAIDWNWKEAELEFKRSLERNPNLAYTCFAYGSSFLVPMGRTDEAVNELKRAVELDPVSLINNVVLVSGYLYARQNDKALEQGFKTYDLEPNFRFGQQWLEQAYIADGNYAEAIALSEKVLKKLPFAQENLAMAGQAYAKSGQRHEAEQCIARLKEMAKTQTVRFYWIAAIYAALGDKDKAFAELEKSYQDRDWFLPRLKVDPIFDSLHDDPRYNDLLNRIGLPTAKTNQTDESLEDKTVMLSTGEAEKLVVPPLGDEVLETNKIPLKSGTTNSTPNSKYLLIGILTLLLAVGGFFGYKYLSPNKQIESIAVMPFVNESKNEDVEYLSDGMTETLISSLSNIPNLSVKARSTVFYYKGKETSPKKIGEELKVQAVLLGRVSERGDDLKLSLELVNTETQDVIWSEQYNRKQSDLVSLQSEIAKTVSAKLRLKLTATEQERVSKTNTTSSEAQQLYLKGRFHWNKRKTDDFQKAREYFEQAIAADPNYALAHTGLADTLALMPYYGDFRPSEYMPLAKQSAQKALEIDPKLAEAHASLGWVLVNSDCDFKGAERELKRAIELDPRYSSAYQWLSLLYLYSGNNDQAQILINKAVELDPLSMVINNNKGRVFEFGRKQDEAIAQYKKTLELFPDALSPRINLANIYEAKGMYSEAIEQYLIQAKLAGVSPENIKSFQLTFEKDGFKAYVQKQIEIQLESQRSILEKDKNAYLPSYAIAINYARLRDKEKTLENLNKAYEQREPQIAELKVRLPFDFLRDDPRFKELVKKAGIPE